MSRLTELNLANAPSHPILPNAKLYDVRKILFQWDYEEAEEGYIELEMCSYENYVTLTFTRITDVCLPTDALSSISINILDTSEFITTMPAPIRVQHPSGGGFSFWADSVVRIDHPTVD